jgi:hypothetical protein
MLDIGCGVVAGLLTVALGRFWGQLFPLNTLQLTLLVAVSAAVMLVLNRCSTGSIRSKLLTMASFLLLLLFVWLQPLLPHLFLAISEQTSPGVLQQCLRAVAAGGISRAAVSRVDSAPVISGR